MKHKYLLRLVVVVFIAVVFEATFFQMQYWIMAMSDVTTNITYTLPDCVLHGWTQKSDGLYSEGGQRVIIENISTEVKNIAIDVQIDPIPDYTLVFFTEMKTEIFSDEKCFLHDLEEKSEVNTYVEDLRIDFSNRPGIVLRDMTVTLNELAFNFSISRVVAMILIYFFGTLLFKLQRSTDFLLVKSEL